MDVMELRRLMMAKPYTIGGLPVLIDNARMPTGNGPLSNYVTDSDYFISGFFDTGSTSSKSYMYHYNPMMTNNNSAWTYNRWFNDVNASSVDYWSNSKSTGTQTDENVVANTPGRYVAVTVRKSDANLMYMYDFTNQCYLLKGKDVPDMIGGLIVLKDNARYKSANGLIGDVIEDPLYFLTGIYDTGSTESKSYTYKRWPNDSKNATLRLFNNLNQTSADYWSVQGSSDRTVSTVGRYIVFPILKSDASTAYLYDNTNHKYVFKGSDVPD